MPGVRRGSKLAKKSLLEQSAALDLADAMGCDPDEVDEYVGEDCSGECTGGNWDMGCGLDDTWDLLDDEHRRLAAEADGEGW